MTCPTIQPRRTYRGLITDSARWSGFRHRPGDVVVCTPMKSGTTWAQAIVAMLLSGDDTVDIVNDRPSPWLDHTIRSIEETIADLDAQTTRRCIKTHTPLDGLPVQDNVHYIAIYRHPIDVHFSMRNFISNAIESELKAYYPENESAGFRRFLEGGLDGGDLDMPSLRAIIRHYKQSCISDQENVLVLHYADMQQDPESAVVRIGEQIGISHSPETIADIVAATSFENMKSNSHRFTPYAGKGVWKDDKAFFDSGMSRKWTGRLTAEDLDAYDRKMGRFLSPEARRWLEEGDRQSTA